MQLSDKITKPEDLLKVEDIQHSAFLKECETLFGPLSDDTFWKYREHLRSTYVYKEINFKGKPFHFIHFNEKDPNLIAFTANDKIGKKDGKTFIKPGKYLAQYSGLDNEQIKTIVTNYKHKFVPPELFYASSADDAVRIYEEGPNSCMRGKGWEIENHPVRIYFGPDTKLAYIKNKSGNGVSARCLIRTDKTPNEYINIYGDKPLMEKAFKAANIIPATDGARGCRFPLLWTKGNKDKQLLMPYIDGGISSIYASKKRGEREYMTLGDLPTTDGEIYWHLNSTPTLGYVTMPDTFKCNHCNELEFNENHANIDGYDYCASCAKDLDVVVIDEGYDGLEKRILRNRAETNPNSYFNINNLWYSRKGLEEINKFYWSGEDKMINLSETDICLDSGDRHPKEDLLTLHSIDGGTRYFYRRNHTGLVDTYMNHDTYAFYTTALATKLIKEGAANVSRVSTRLPIMLEETRAANTFRKIEDMVNDLTKHPATQEFLKLHLEHFNRQSEYI